MRSGSSTEAAGANTPSLISGWPSCASGAAKIRCRRQRELEPAAQALAARPRPGSAPAIRASRRAARAAGEHRRAALGQVLLDARAEAEVRPLGVEQHARAARCCRGARSNAPCSAAIIAASTMFAFGRARRSRSSAPSRSSQTFSGAIRHRAMASALALALRLDRVVQRRRPSSRRRRASGAAATKSTSRSSLVPSLNAVKPARASVIMLSASQAREFSLLRFQASSLGLRSSSSVLVVQSGKVSSILAHSSSTLASSSDRSTLPRAMQRLACLQRVAGLRTRRRRSGRTRRSSAASPPADWRRTCRPP